MLAERSTFLLAALALIALAYGQPSSRILEGQDAASGQFPWTVSVRVDNAAVGVGNIISENFILTAAHIVTKIAPERINVRVGSTNQYSGGELVQVASIAEHPSFGNFLHDLCLMKLVKPLTFSATVAKIGLPELNEDIAEGTPVTLAGWGLLSNKATPYRLQHTVMQVMSRSECELAAGYGYESALCLQHAEGKGFCRGDDGAGAVADNKLVGIASFAFGSCGTKYPDVAVRVAYYIEWIMKNTA